MTIIWKLLRILSRLLCYAGLLLVVAGFASLYIAQGDCPRLDTGSIECNSEWSRELGTFALSVMLVSFFTGVPLALALGGVAYLIVDVSRWWKRRRAVM